MELRGEEEEDIDPYYGFDCWILEVLGFFFSFLGSCIS